MAIRKSIIILLFFAILITPNALSYIPQPDFWADLKTDYEDKTGNFTTITASAPNCAGTKGCNFANNYVNTGMAGSYFASKQNIVMGCWASNDDWTSALVFEMPMAVSENGAGYVVDGIYWQIASSNIVSQTFNGATAKFTQTARDADTGFHLYIHKINATGVYLWKDTTLYTNSSNGNTDSDLTYLFLGAYNHTTGLNYYWDGNLTNCFVYLDSSKVNQSVVDEIYGAGWQTNYSQLNLTNTPPVFNTAVPDYNLSEENNSLFFLDTYPVDPQGGNVTLTLNCSFINLTVTEPFSYLQQVAFQYGYTDSGGAWYAAPTYIYDNNYSTAGVVNSANTEYFMANYTLDRPYIVDGVNISYKDYPTTAYHNITLTPDCFNSSLIEIAFELNTAGVDSVKSYCVNSSDVSVLLNTNEVDYGIYEEDLIWRVLKSYSLNYTYNASDAGVHYCQLLANDSVAYSTLNFTVNISGEAPPAFNCVIAENTLDEYQDRVCVSLNISNAVYRLVNSNLTATDIIIENGDLILDNTYFNWKV